MTAQPAPLPNMHEFEDVLAAVRDYMDEHGVPASTAADALLPTMHMTGAAHDRLVRSGVIFEAGIRDHDDRQHALNGEPARTSGVGPPQAAKMQSLLDRLSYQGADGRRKRLSHFTPEDWGAFRQMARARMVGWRERAKVAKWAEEAMKAEDIAFTRDLPPDLFAELERKVQETW